MEVAVGMSAGEERQPGAFQSVDLQFPVRAEAELRERKSGKARRLWYDGTALLQERNGPHDGILFQSQNEFIPPAQGNVSSVCQVRGFVDGTEDKTVAFFGKNSAEAPFCHDDAATAERLPDSGKRICHGEISVILWSGDGRDIHAGA